jgi:hypothetical protein
MARYNTVAPVGSQTSAGTIATPNQGLFTTLTGTAPYTVTIANPVLYAGATQTFFNNTSGVITLSTPNGTFKGPGSTGSATITMQSNTLLQIISDGTDYVTVQDDGSAFTATTGQFSSTVNADGNFSVNTNKFNVTASSGDTTVAGTLGVTGVASFNTNSHMLLPKGTDSNRPSGVAGMMRYNTDRNIVETYTGSGWQANGIYKQVDVLNSSYTASVFDQCWVSTTSSALTITLPGSPVKGDSIRFIDIGRTFAARNLTIARNGKPIQGDAADLTVNTNGAAFELVFYDNTYGWRIFSI